MKLSLYSLKDTKSGFETPFTFDNNQSVVRAVRNNVLNGARKGLQSPLFTNPEDFQIFKVGVFDTETGIISDNNTDFVCNVGDIVSLAELSS